jgi:hypothetical protein
LTALVAVVTSVEDTVEAIPVKEVVVDSLVSTTVSVSVTSVTNE